MFFKTATVACSLAALLMVGCEPDNEVEEQDTIVAPGDDYSPDTPAPGAPGDDLDPTAPPEFPEDTMPAPGSDLPEDDAPTLGVPLDDESDADEPVVEEVESDSLPEEDEEE